MADERSKHFVQRMTKECDGKYEFAEDFVLPAYKSGVQIRVFCKEHERWFEVLPYNLNTCKGCPLCRSRVGSQVSLNERSILFKRRIDEDGRFELLSEFTGSRAAITLMCKTHAEEFTVNEATKWRQSKGCKKCRKRTGPKTMSTAEIVQRFNERHGAGTFDYSEVVYKGWFESVCIKCKEGHVFYQTPNTHMEAKPGNGCRECHTEWCRTEYALTYDDFVARARVVHPNKNYDYSAVDYKNKMTHVLIACPEGDHGLFKQSPHSHLLGYEGCVLCSKKGYSQAALDWLKFKEREDNTTIRTILHIDREFIVPEINKPVDGYSEQLHKVYEYQGCHIHGCPKCFKPTDLAPFSGRPMGELYKNAVERAAAIRAAGYDYEEIWHCESWPAATNN